MHTKSFLYVFHLYISSLFRYPQSWFDSSQQNNHNLYTDDTDADSVFMHLNNPPHLNNSGGTHKRRTSFSSNASMSELSTLTRNNNITYASKDTYHKYDNSPQKSTSPKNVNNMPSARSFSEPWVYNVNPTVVSTFGSPTSAGMICFIQCLGYFAISELCSNLFCM